MCESRRAFLASASAAVLSAFAAPASAQTVVPGVFANGDRPLVAFPQKRPLMVLTPRPPQLETPFAVFDDGVFTPNDAFFVRWHLANIPTSIDGAAHRIAVGGAVAKTLSLSVADLRRMPAVQIAAVNQCSGNSRGFFDPRPAGGQWQNGAMGNALWTGVRLREILDRAGLKPGAKQVQFNGLDEPTIAATRDFKKSLDVDVARGDDVIVAYEMNGAPLPVLNGFPVRLVVPGWYSTYWVKMLSEITAIDHVDDQFWMKTAYRIPDTPRHSVAPSDKDYPTIPINRMAVRSFVTNIASGQTIKAGSVTVRGIAFDGGSGIKSVEFSPDGGTTWTPARLERDYGRYSFRRWTADATLRPGAATLACRAVANDGATQTTAPIWNPGGYMRNVIEQYKVTVA
ncbi:molybdopterin-dependent oxidoreductase [Vulcanimicrobium alpinum]|uniref:molybdopterin-dependent oxidoreductase n=1 Tax=Vulcanimicrobium alpinum TaxID=3016050 RepID=UPI00295EA10A|nr:molybdopterin-dependent oxidoreductase [Vulcanimicrobium alpinum]